LVPAVVTGVVVVGAVVTGVAVVAAVLTAVVVVSATENAPNTIRVSFDHYMLTAESF